jgi:transglutaminase-like putative cysteine protease
MIYMYSKILDYYNTNNVLPNYVSVKPWNKFTVDQIASAATNVKTYIQNNQKLPEYVTINGLNVGMPSFLELLTTAVLQVNNGNTTSIDYNVFGSSQSPTEQVNSGNLYKNEYIELASRIKSYMDSNGIAPNYGSTTLGKIRYESLIDIYSRILSYYSTNRVLPNYASVKPWSSLTSSSTSTTTETLPSSLQIYLQATANCQSNNPTIIAMAQSITSGATSSYEKAQRIFNWVRDNLEYSFYYNTQKGAVNTLSSRSANCCDHSHLLVALSRAAGLPARYVHGTCTFSSGTYGHVWAQIYVNGQWYNADAISYRNELGVIRNWDTNSWTYKGTYAELPF